MDISQEIHRILIESMKSKSATSIKQLLLCDPTGLIIAKVSRKKITEISFNDYEGIASISAAIYLGLDINNIKLGSVEVIVTDFSLGKLFLIGDKKNHVIIAITYRNASTTKIKGLLKKINESVTERVITLKKSIDNNVKVDLPPSDRTVNVKNNLDKLLEEGLL